MATPVKSFRPAPVVEQVAARNGGGKGLSHRIAQIADRYGALLTEGAPDLPEPEWNLLRDALNGWWPEPAEQIIHLEIEIEDAIAIDGLDRKWQVDGAALLAKLRAMPLAGKISVVEAIEKWWSDQADARRA